MTTPIPAIPGTPIPGGTWVVDPSTGGIGFEVRFVWGLARVRGTFARYRGALIARSQGATGELVIEAASVDTDNARRDAHLRSADFFDVDRHPEIVFTISTISTRPDGLTASGELRIGSKIVDLDLPVFALHSGDRLTLHTVTYVSRARAGLTWNRVGMVRGDAKVTVDLELTRQRP